MTGTEDLRAVVGTDAETGTDAGAGTNAETGTLKTLKILKTGTPKNLEQAMMTLELMIREPRLELITDWLGQE